MRTTIAVEGHDGSTVRWVPTTLDQIGRHEADLEAALSRTPQLLCLETKRTGVYGPFTVFNQLPLDTPQGQTVYPDIVLLAASGDIVIVEVKLFANPELRDRRVIAQAIHYASSVSALSTEQITRLFNGGADGEWTELVRAHFPLEADSDELAETLLTNARDGNVHIVVACDKAPLGAYELAKSVSAQSHLAFSLNIVEVTPFVPSDGTLDAIMFVPNLRLATEIVARTAVSVTYEAGSPQPGVTVETTSIEEIEEGLASAARGGSRRTRGRLWTDEEVEELFLSSDDPIVRDLFLFVKQESYQGQFHSRLPKITAAFNHYARVRRPDGSETANAVFQHVDGTSYVRVFMNWAPELFPQVALAECRADLKRVFGQAVNAESPEPTIRLAALDGKLEEFKAVMRKLKQSIELQAGS